MIVNNIQSVNKIMPVKDFFQAMSGQLFQVEIISKEENNEGMITLGKNQFLAQLEPQFQKGDKFLVLVKEVTEEGIILSRVHPENIPTQPGERLTEGHVSHMLSKGFGLSEEDSLFLAKYLCGKYQDEGPVEFKRQQPEIQLQPGKQAWTLQKGIPVENPEQNLFNRYSLFNQKHDIATEQSLRLTAGQLNTILNRGIPINQETTTLLAKYVNDYHGSELKTILTNTTAEIKPLISFLLKAIPEWSTLNGKQFEAILTYLKKLGLEHESQLVYQMKAADSHQGSEPKEMSPSVKSMLLSLLTDGSLGGDNAKAAANLLDNITGQQLWIQSGQNDAAYFLLQLPLRDNDSVRYCHVAVESSRKGLKADASHCHIALQVETENLNVIGADINLYNSHLSICLISDGEVDLASLIDGFSENIKQNFSDIGLSIDKIICKTYEECPQFTSFISGQNRVGVDIRG
ncbi:hypothetical protein LPY66_11925 [Dehalobacter sp. DCM]|uniref:hypothetical protein n=1 Tax=Dehalobacter sp. DCM TaxID=2907827 RepID=UPI0030816000|nr:hypothetical protein LPY66_11925 [Dehalobacter sp. DCM]